MIPVSIEGPIRVPESYEGLCVKFRGLHDEDKPSNVGDGSGFYEMDTGDYYMFDATNSLWRKQ